MSSSVSRVRDVLSEEYASLSDEELFDALDAEFGPGAVEDIENFMRSLQSFGRQAGRFVQRAGPGAASGAIAGASTGAALGPYGALVGGLLGAVAGGAQSYMSSGQQRARPQSGRPPARPSRSPQPRPTAPNRPPTPPRPVAAPAAPMPSPRAATAPAGNAQLMALLSLLARPEVQRALTSVALGSAGATTTRVGGQRVPSEAIAQLVGSIADGTSAGLAVSPTSSGAESFFVDDFSDVFEEQLCESCRQ